MSKKARKLLIVLSVLLSLCAIVGIYLLYRNAPHDVESGESIYLKKEYIDYEYGKDADEFLPEINELGEYERIDFEVLDPSSYIERKTKYERVFVLHVEYGDGEYEKQLHNMQMKHNLLLYSNYATDYTGYIVVDETELNSHIALLINQPEKNRITYVYIACPEISVLSVAGTLIRYPLWDVKSVHIIGDDWNYYGSTETYYDRVEDYSHYLERVENSRNYIPTKDKLGDYESISVVQKEIEMSFYNKSVAVFVEYKNSKYSNEKNKLLSNVELLDEKKAGEYNIYDIEGHVNGFDLYVVYMNDDEYFNKHNIFIIGFNDEEKVISYMFKRDSFGRYDLCYIENLDSFAKHNFFMWEN